MVIDARSAADEIGAALETGRRELAKVDLEKVRDDALSRRVGLLRAFGPACEPGPAHAPPAAAATLAAGRRPPGIRRGGPGLGLPARREGAAWRRNRRSASAGRRRDRRRISPPPSTPRRPPSCGHGCRRWRAAPPEGRVKTPRSIDSIGASFLCCAPARGRPDPTRLTVQPTARRTARPTVQSTARRRSAPSSGPTTMPALTAPQPTARRTAGSRCSAPWWHQACMRRRRVRSPRQQAGSQWRVS